MPDTGIRLTFVKPSSLGRLNRTGTPGASVEGLITSVGITLNIRHKKERKSKRVLCNFGYCVSRGSYTKSLGRDVRCQTRG